MNNRSPKAFAPLMTDRVTVHSVTQTPGRADPQTRLLNCRCRIFPAGDPSAAGPSGHTQTGEFFQVLIPGSEWACALPPAAGSCKIDSVTYGTLHVKKADRIGDDFSLLCIGEGVRA